MNDSKKAINHPDILIHSDTTIERAMRRLKEQQDLEAEKDAEKSVDRAPVDKMKHSPVVKK